MKGKIEISEQILRNLYEKENLTTYQIALKLNYCQATIWKNLIKFDIKPKLAGVKRVKISKKELSNLYTKEKLSTWKIEKLLDIPRSTIHRKLKEYKIKTRDNSESHIIYPKKNFSGNILEKAYLIGFRLGDLRVRKQYKNGKTISIACSSTIPEQIELLKNLFADYSHIWEKKVRNVIHFEVWLNESFSFLLTKKSPITLFENKNKFFAFLAGFTDAEGNIGIYNKMARYQLGNYNSEILFNIYKSLIKHKINCHKPFKDHRKGKLNNQGYPYNKDYWQLRISKKEDLINLFNEMGPYIKHKRKIKALNKAIENIIQRNNRNGETKKLPDKYCN